MTEGRRWLAVDADMFSKRFINDLHERFGPAGVAVWVAFLCACKMSSTQGKVRMNSDIDGMSKLGLLGWDLVDSKGEPFTLTEFFGFTGRKKQTRRVAVQLSDSRRIADQRLLDVCATHWEHWQDAWRMQDERLRKRRWRAENGRDMSGTDLGHARDNVPPDSDIDIDSDNPPTPQIGKNRKGANDTNCHTCWVDPCVCPTEPTLAGDQLARAASKLRKP